MRIALVVGHTEKAPGACNANARICEFEWNSELAGTMEKNPLWEQKGIQVQRLWRPETNSISKLVDYVNASHPDVFVELHANAFNKRASGTETLHWYSSAKGKDLAAAIQNAMTGVLELPDRGLKAIRSGERGAIQLGTTRPVAILTEPFFIDNDGDLSRANARKKDLANALTHAIANWMVPSSCS